VFENSIFRDCRFRETEIEARTVTSNFGLKLDLMENCRVRDGRVSKPHQFIAPSAFTSLVGDHGDDPLVLLTVRYFLDGNLLAADAGTDKVFDIAGWARMARQPASFTQLLELLAEFLVNAYERNEVDMHKLLLLHDITRRIVHDRSPEALSSRYAFSFGAIHLALSRSVEDYLAALDDLSRAIPGNLRVVSEGPLSKDYFEHALGEFLPHCGIEITEVRPYNSVEIEFAELVLGGKFYALALILASFVRIDLKAAQNRNRTALSRPDASPSGTALPTVLEKREFFHLTSGISEDERRAYELRIKALVPTTSIVVDLKLAVSTVLVRKLRAVILKILQ
jgi:hypothetical protein